MQSKQPTKSPIKGARNDIRRESHGTEGHVQTQPAQQRTPESQHPRRELVVCHCPLQQRLCAHHAVAEQKHGPVGALSVDGLQERTRARLCMIT